MKFKSKGLYNMLLVGKFKFNRFNILKWIRNLFEFQITYIKMNFNNRRSKTKV